MRCIKNTVFVFLLGAAALGVNISTAVAQGVTTYGDSVIVDMSAIGEPNRYSATDFLLLSTEVKPATRQLRQPPPHAPSSTLHVAPGLPLVQEKAQEEKTPQVAQIATEPPTAIDNASPAPPTPPSMQAAVPPEENSAEETALPSIPSDAPTPTPAHTPPPPQPNSEPAGNKSAPVSQPTKQAEDDAPPPNAAPTTPVITKTATPAPTSESLPANGSAEQVALLEEDPSSRQLTVLFDQESTDLSQEMTNLLKDFTGKIVDSEDQIQVRAFAGGEELSAGITRRVSLYRALAIHKYLVENGVASNRINVRALGKKTNIKPIDRVDISVIKR